MSLPDKNPYRLFKQWFSRAKKSPGLKNPNALCLSTLGPSGMPDARMVLLKGLDDKGFVFYTNLKSAKGRQILKTRRAALTFYWEKLGFQVRVQGRAALVSKAEADAYFKTRPRFSQIGAWASKQSGELKSRAILLAQAARYALKFKGREVPRPAHWTGVRVVPGRMEFWRERPFRLHDRFLYVRRGKSWSVRRLYP